MDRGLLQTSNGRTGPFVSAPLASVVDRTTQLISDRDIESIERSVKDTDRSIRFTNCSLDAHPN